MLGSNLLFSQLVDAFNKRTYSFMSFSSSWWVRASWITTGSGVEIWGLNPETFWLGALTTTEYTAP